ncbi:MAG TPA: hypothetical protein VI702_00605 [Nitrospiria bacterium]
MVQKIRKKTKKGPKAPHAIPLAIVLTALYGFQREGRDFRRTFDDPARLRAALRLHLDQEVLTADRVLSPGEYAGWSLRNAPARLFGMFSRDGVIPMGPPREEEAGTHPRLGLLPCVAVVQGRHLDSLSDRIGRDWAELASVAFQNSVRSAFNLIPSYDQLLYPPPVHARDINRAVEVLNRMVEDAFHQAGRSRPGPFDPLPGDILAVIPLEEACPK